MVGRIQFPRRRIEEHEHGEEEGKKEEEEEEEEEEWQGSSPISIEGTFTAHIDKGAPAWGAPRPRPAQA